MSRTGMRPSLITEITHEMRNHIDGARRLIELARRPDVNSAQANEFLQDAVESLRRMEWEIATLCALDATAAPEAASQPLRLQLDHFLDSAVTAERYPRVQFVREYASLGDAGVGTDCAAIIENLVRNAAQAMIGVGTVQIHGDVRDGECVLQLRDTGPGVPEALREHIFEPFYTTKADQGGTGVGLAICRRLLEAVGGSLRYVHKPDAGAIFELRIPIVPGGVTPGDTA